MAKPTKYSAAFRRCLVDLDVRGIRKLWQQVSPHLPQPKSDAEALATLHMARTQAESVGIKLRAYSHQWLIERGLPSLLPDELKPKAQRIYPVISKAVGISVNARSELVKPIVPFVYKAMSDAVLEAFADRRTESSFVKSRMFEAKRKITKQLLGIR